MSIPFFSICIPAYNCGDIIYEAFRSVMRQSFQDWEVLVYDDGSMDDTASVCQNQTIVPMDKYTFIAGHHGGQLLARKKLTEQAAGRVVISLDADDMLIGDSALSKIYSMFSKTGCDLVAFNATRSLETREPFVDYSAVMVDRAGVANMDSVRKTFCASYALNNVAFKAYKREKLRFEETPPELNMTEDRFQTALLLERCESMAIIDEPLYYYRINEGSITEMPFELKYFSDQMFVEDKVNGLLSEWELDRREHESLLATVLYGDIVAVRRTTADANQRLSTYRQIRESPHYPWSDSGLMHRGLRLDKILALEMLNKCMFKALDCMLSARLWARNSLGK